MLRKDDISSDDVCSFLKTRRDYNRKYLRNKTISIRIDRGDNDEIISVRAMVKVNINTGVVTVSHGIQWAGKQIFPTQCHKKHNCRTEDAKTVYQSELNRGRSRDHRVKNNEYYIRNKERILNSRKLRRQQSQSHEHGAGDAFTTPRLHGVNP